MGFTAYPFCAKRFWYIDHAGEEAKRLLRPSSGLRINLKRWVQHQYWPNIYFRDNLGHITGPVYRRWSSISHRCFYEAHSLLNSKIIEGWDTSRHSIGQHWKTSISASIDFMPCLRIMGFWAVYRTVSFLNDVAVPLPLVFITMSTVWSYNTSLPQNPYT